MGFAGSALGFAVGVLLLYLAPGLPALWPLVSLSVALAVASRFFPVLWPLAFLAIGLAWAQVHACRMLCEPFPEGYTRQDLVVEGRIASLPEETAGAVRFLFRVDSARREGLDIGFTGLVRLAWYVDQPDLRPGERWRLSVRLKPPHGFANPGGFAYERWLFLQGIRATGSVRDKGVHQRLEDGPGRYPIDRWRQGLQRHISDTLSGEPGQGLVRALVLGDRSGLSPEQWEVLARTGTNHLVAISGLHVGLVAAFLFFLVRRAWSLSARLVLAAPAPRAAAVVAFLGAFGYSGLAGFAVSTQRALIMLAVVLGAIFWGRIVRPAAGLLLALVGVLLLDPGAVLSYGFWLSFGAVAVLLYSLGRRLPDARVWSRWGRAQWAVAVGLLPMLLLLFGRASLVAPLVNLLAVPLFSLILLPGVLTATMASLLPGLDSLLVGAAYVLDRGFGLLVEASTWSWAVASVSGRPGWVWVSAFSGALLLLVPRGVPGRWLGVLLLSPLLLVRPAVPAPGEAEFTLLDVGQGLSAVVRTRHHALVYDVGPAYASGFNTAEAVLLPFLREEGIERIDLLILSHADRDHAGGFPALNARIPIGGVLSGEPTGEKARPCRTGDAWTWDGVRFELLHPDEEGLKGNDSSCVLSVRTSGASVLLPGDIGGRVEDRLAAEMGTRLRSDILVASHHGSAGSSSAVFLAAVAPRYVLYSTGFADRFGFPAQEVRERVAALGAAQLDTAATGAIRFRLGRDALVGPDLHRQRQRRLWTHVPFGAERPF